VVVVDAGVDDTNLDVGVAREDIPRDGRADVRSGRASGLPRVPHAVELWEARVVGSAICVQLVVGSMYSMPGSLR